MTREEIQALIDALPPAGGQVTIPAGTHTLDGKLTIATDYVDLFGEDGATLYMQDGTIEANYGLLSITGSYARVRNLTFDGNKVNQGVYVLTPEVVNLTNADHALIYNCEVCNSKGDGIQAVACSYVWLWNVYAHDNDEHATHYNGVTNGWVMDCTLKVDGHALHAQGHGGCWGVIVEHNVFEHAATGVFAVQVSADDTPAGMRAEIQVIGNSFLLNGSKGITICEDATNILIQDNIFRDATPSPAIVQVGANPTNVTIQDNEGIPPGTISYL